jgi:uncharacterized damage-inducible protein DinB
MLETEVAVNRFLIGYAKMLVAELDDTRLSEQPMPGVNHPAWILGHLTFVAHRAMALINDGDVALPESWKASFSPGSKLTANRADYPTKAELLQAFEEGHQALHRTIESATPEQLTKPSTHPRSKAMLPQVKDLLAFLLTGHMGVHLGQLTTWRRMIGLPALF